MANRYTVPSVDLTVRIVNLLASSEGRRGLGVTQIGRHLGASKASCYNVLQTLIPPRWVEFDPQRKTYSLGTAFLELGAVVSEKHDLLRLFRTHAAEFTAETGWACLLAHLTPHRGIVVIDKIESRQPIKVTVALGEHFPITAAALGKCFLAWRSPEERERLLPPEPLPAYTPRSLTRRSDLEADLALVRRRGYSTSIGEYYSRNNAVAAPVFDGEGKVAFVVCTLAFNDDLTSELVPTYGEKIRELARHLTAATGGRWPEEDPAAPRAAAQAGPGEEPTPDTRTRPHRSALMPDPERGSRRG